MKNAFWFKGLRLWVQGLLLLAIRWAQLKNGFDPATGLSRQSLPGTVLAALIVLLAVVEAVLSWKLPGKKGSYRSCFEPVETKDIPLLAAGSFLLCAGGVLLPGWDVLEIATAAAGAATAAGFLLFAKRLRGGREAKAIPLMPAMVFSVLFVLVVYLPEAGNPVLARYYLIVLASALLSCAFYQLAGLACREGKLRWFVFFGDLAVPLSLAAMADCAGNLGRMLVYFGCALVLTVFLVLRRNEPLPEPEEESEKASQPQD